LKERALKGRGFSRAATTHKRRSGGTCFFSIHSRKPVWNGHSCPLPLTLLLQGQTSATVGAPFSRVLCEKWESRGQPHPPTLSFRPEPKHQRRRWRNLLSFPPTYWQPVSLIPGCSPSPSHSRLCVLVSFATPLEVHRPRQESFPSQRVQEYARFPSDPHGCFFPGNTPRSAGQKPSPPRPR
jgi:hypothetical protein